MVSNQKVQQVPLDVDFHPNQLFAFHSPATEILFGGAAGGGKSHWLRMSLVVWCFQIPGLQCYLFRRLLPDLIKTHVDGPTGFDFFLQPLVEHKKVKIVEDQVRFLDQKSKIHLCHCQDEKDVKKYLSTDMHILAIDEASEFTEQMIRFLRTRVRMPVEMKELLPPQIRDCFPRVIYTSNPGGPAHEFFRSGFVGLEPRKIYRMPKSEGGMKRQYIPSRLKDNPSLNYEEYSGQIEGLGDEALVRAYLDGDWNAVQGAFFSTFGVKNIIAPFTIPPYWTRILGFDWGSYDPFHVGWYAVVSNDFYLSFKHWQYDWKDEELSDEEKEIGAKIIPAGSIIKYNEWVGADAKGAGLKYTTRQISDGIKERSDRNWDYAIAGHDIFRKREVDISERFTAEGIHFRSAPVAREQGWQELQERIAGINGTPAYYIFQTCRTTIEVYPLAQHDEKNVKDLVYTNDHPLDTDRYVMMSRPYANEAPVKKDERLTGMEGLTLNKLYELEAQRKRRRR